MKNYSIFIIFFERVRQILMLNYMYTNCINVNLSKKVLYFMLSYYLYKIFLASKNVKKMYNKFFFLNHYTHKLCTVIYNSCQ